jgi:hypothetical protein
MQLMLIQNIMESCNLIQIFLLEPEMTNFLITEFLNDSSN